MINVRYRDDGHSRTLEVQGHGPGEKGKDIFCAGASALVIALEKNLQDTEHKCTVNDGYAAFKCETPQSKQAFNHCLQGFYALEELYPEQYSVQTY